MTSLSWKLFWAVMPIYTLSFIIITTLMGQSLTIAVITGLMNGLIFGAIFAPLTAWMHRRGIRRRGFEVPCIVVVYA
ncbi:hypothetical protein ACQ4M3_12700 [Leptolyngbya sp. AN03gr2]|uniref:hypothetical protein n=1 Tax=unclassified Leptolyngbya TaxID=2650499 RepID=UPI003D3206B0